MPLPAPARDFYRTQQRLIVATLALTRSAWERVDFEDLDGSWAKVAPVLARVVTSSQLASARNGAGYVGPTLDSLGESVRPEARVNVAAFAGLASDGRSLVTLLEGAKVRAKEAQSLVAGGKWLEMAAHTMVADAGRQAASVDMVTRPRVGYVRAVNPPCCQRCAVLAGAFYKVEGFQRHPRCDCFMIPTTVAKPNGFGQSIEPEDIKDLTKDQRQAIADGADMNQVINSHRAGARSKNGMTTTEGVTRRGIDGKRLIEQGGSVRGAGRYSSARAARLTPEGIYRRAGGNRDKALTLLRQHGYIV